MPEGPEIRRAAMRIDKVLRGREAEVVERYAMERVRPPPQIETRQRVPEVRLDVRPGIVQYEADAIHREQLGNRRSQRLHRRRRDVQVRGF